MSKLALTLVALFFAAGTPLTAATPTKVQNKWLVTQLSGDARVVHPGLQTVSVKVNSEVAPGDILVTGTSGRATLVRGADYIVVAPHSELRLPAAPQPSGFTRVIQNLGTMLFKIQHTGVPHFAVDTPMLAAVVKGTTFTVVVDQDRSAVQVIQGVVQVNAVEGGMMRMVEGGRTVFINHDNPRMLYDADKPAPPVTRPAASAIRVSAAEPAPAESISSLTGGLVRTEQAQGLAAGAARGVEPASPAAAPAVTAASTPVEAPAARVSMTSVGTAPPAAAPAAPPVVAVASVAVSSMTPVVPTVATLNVGSVATPSVVVPSVTTPAVTIPSVALPAVPAPPVSVVPAAVTVPTVTTPGVAVSSVSTPGVSVSSVNVGSVATPAVAVTNVTTPAVTVPTQTVTVPSTVTAPTVTVASVTAPAVTALPVVTPVPPATAPTLTVPSVTTPTVTTPLVTVPDVTTPQVTVSVPPLLGS